MNYTVEDGCILIIILIIAKMAGILPGCQSQMRETNMVCNLQLQRGN